MLVSAALPPCEGMGFYVWNLSRYLTSQGHQVQIITRGKPGQESHEVINGITIWRPFFAPLYPFHVHLHSLFVSTYINKLEAETDLFHCHSPLVPPIKTKRPAMLSFHSTIPEDVKSTKLNGWHTFLMKLQVPVSYRLEMENIKRATAVNAISPHVAQILHRYPYCPKDVPVVWNGVDTNIFKPMIEYPLKNDFILTVGRLGPGKGMEDLVDAIYFISRQKRAIKLVITGEGPLKHFLEQRVNAYGLKESIRFEGHISDRNHLIHLYQKTSLFVLPSHHEGLPTVMLEAMACGCPVLATDVGGVPDIIKDGVNGVLIPAKDSRRMASVIQSLLADPEKLYEMGVQARETVEERFSWDKIGKNFIDLYSSIR